MCQSSLPSQRDHGKKLTYHCFRADYQQAVAPVLERLQAKLRFDVDIFCVGKECEWKDFGRAFDDATIEYQKVIILFQEPIPISAMKELPKHVLRHNASEMKTFRFKETPGEKTDDLQECLEKWSNHPKKEKRELKVGSLVCFDSHSSEAKDSPLHFYASAMLDSMGDILFRLQKIVSSFVDSIESDFINRLSQLPQGQRITTLAAYREHIKGKLRNAAPREQRNSPAAPTLSANLPTPNLPKVLLLGDSGVGKSLISNLIHERVMEELESRKLLGDEPGRDKRYPLRIALPEFDKKEDDFEYRLFGYAPNAFTGADPNGNIGLIAENIGQVLFLDEFGAASSSIQAKLLAYLDDYKIRPREWRSTPFLCPTLVVAASNEIQKVKDKNRFRNDLLARFTDLIEIPSLAKRINHNKETFKYILDCVLQEKANNPADGVKEIGEHAFEILWNRFSQGSDGNFRELGNWIREACRHAQSDQRDYMVKEDAQFAKERWQTEIPNRPNAITFRLHPKCSLAGHEEIFLKHALPNDGRFRTIQQIYLDLQTEFPNISMSAVQRALDALKKHLAKQSQ